MILSKIQKVTNKNQYYGKIKLNQKILIRCDKCEKIFYSKYDAAIKNREFYIDDLCRSCKQKFQYQYGLREKQKEINTKRIIETQTGKTLEQIIGVEKAKIAKQKMSLKSSGKNNINYGGKYNTGFGSKYQPSHLGKTYEELYGKEKADKMKMNLSKKFSGKKNHRYGIPTARGSGNGWQGWYKGWYFRSLLELSYMVNVIEKNKWKWENAESKKYKIPYIIDNKERNYFCDFLINDNQLTEIKPKNLRNSKQVLIKEEAAIVWCEEHSLMYKIVCDNEFKKLTFEEIKILYNNGLIKFIDRYEEKYNVRFKQIEK